jgi:hypothetical protein
MQSDRVHNGPGKNMYIVILMTTIRKIYDIFQLTLRNHNLVLKVLKKITLRKLISFSV